MGRLLRRLSVVIFVVLLILTLVSSWAVHSAIRSQEHRLLKERTNEVSLVLTNAVTTLAQQFDVLGGVLHATNNSPSAFKQSSDGPVEQSKGLQTYALLTSNGPGFRVISANGNGLHRGEVVSGVRADAMRRAAATGVVVPTEVIGSGAQRSVGFAVGPPVAPAGTVMYEQSIIGPLGPPRTDSTDAYSELEIVLYASRDAIPSQALVSTVPHPPLTGEVRATMVKVGDSRLLLQVAAASPLVGSVTAQAAWLMLAGGLVLSLLVAVAVETETRRRRSAVALYQGEHQLAESLQRSLLPQLPAISDLRLGARYLAGSAEQQVGGDWYDLFELDGGRTGIVVGDVVGHDVSAAVLMSRVQTALRAYAVLDQEPAAVLDRLDRLIGTFDTDRLVTVFYGVLGPADPTGGRRLVFANAGHPPPLIYRHEGAVEDLDGVDSLLLGVTPTPAEPRPQREISLPPGAMLMLYTDGLVEIPGQSLTDLIARLRSVAATVPAAMAPDEVCDLLLSRMNAGERRRDDIAILIAQLAPALLPRQPAVAAHGSTHSAGP